MTSESQGLQLFLTLISSVASSRQGGAASFRWLEGWGAARAGSGVPPQAGEEADIRQGTKNTWLWLSKLFGITFWGIGEFTAHCRTHFSGD